MQLHGDLTATASAPAWLARQLNGVGVKDGAYARVVVTGPYEVVKLNTCKATERLLRALNNLRITERPVPAGLPAVLDKYGSCAVDSQGFTYQGWLLERLFEPNCLDEMKRARVTGKRVLSQLKPGYAKSFSRETNPELLADLNAALAEEQSLLPDVTLWTHCAQMALNMALRTEGALKETFLWLDSFIRRERVALDLLTQGNILVNMFGHPVLCDPVCASSGVAETREAHPDEGLSCLVAYVPVVIDGVNVQVRALSTLALTDTELAPIREGLLKLGIQGTEVIFGSSAHRALISEKPTWRRLWNFANATQNIKEDRYRKVLYDAEV